ncbi:MAG: hypothetical protein PWR14_799 [Thermosediminibacterales bacterium]|nr:hypothetical protein [Thermosediminibacterales bacterium]
MLELDGSLAMIVEPAEIPDIEAETAQGEGQEEQQRWRIENDLIADWAIEKIKRFRAELERKRQLAEEKKRQIDMWYKSEQEKIERDIKFFEQKLYEYYMSLDPKQLRKGKAQTKYELMSGTLKLKKQNPDIEREKETLVAWLEGNGLTEYIKIVKEPDWAKLREKVKITDDKAVYPETGEIIPGIKVNPRPDKFIVE